MGWRIPEEAASVERRRTERLPACWGSWIAYMDGTNETKCVTLDHSYMGAKIQVESQHQVPQDLYYLDLRNRLAYEACVVWRAGSHAGLQFLKVYRFDQVPVERLRSLISELCSVPTAGEKRLRLRAVS